MKHLIKIGLIHTRVLIYKRPTLDRNIKKILKKFPFLTSKLKKMVQIPVHTIGNVGSDHFRFPLDTELETCSDRAKEIYYRLKNDVE